ncbi:uncharacterized protein LOC117171586 isoform X2 [Belonocnema kinseyi]|uniref:uncharacterized protein LOC117171586 isoform X2 n=1 Tax=Belonocnema kinseyi TaxID=2817044 RepID=UPI00143D5994|nr:uncharacterized protein LOC117171586 isoform X2 [Belonocnema kinseyi]
MSRKCESGASKRKKIKMREDFEKKLPKLTTFFKNESEFISSSHSSEENENSGEVENTNLITEAIEDIHRRSLGFESLNNDESGIITNSQSNDETVDVGLLLTPQYSKDSNTLQDEINQDPALWPKLDDSIKQKILEKCSEYFQNKDSNFSASSRR